MSAATPGRADWGPKRSAHFHRWRSRKDRLARFIIAVGGIAVIIAVLLLFFYLLYVVYPLFRPAAIESVSVFQRADWAGSMPVMLALDEQLAVGTRVTADGAVEFFDPRSGATVLQGTLLPGNDSGISAITVSNERDGLLATAARDGRIYLSELDYRTQFDGSVDSRRVVPAVGHPYGRHAVLEVPGEDVLGLALTSNGSRLLLAVLTTTSRLHLLAIDRDEDPTTEETSSGRQAQSKGTGFEASRIELSSDQRWLYAAGGDGVLHRLRTSDLEEIQSVDLGGGAISAMDMLLGGISVLAGDDTGRITQLFPVRHGIEGHTLEIIRTFDLGESAIRQIEPEHRRKGFVAVNASGELAVFHTTAGRKVHQLSLKSNTPRAIALSPRANALLLEAENGRLEFRAVANPHPEISRSSLWSRTWYENYPEPQYVWQSSAATTDFEPKFSLSPLVFGTVKAAVYAMLFAVPLALLAAAYTAYFMAPRLRNWVKPGIEIMAALPTVILGFLAGLWLAPFLEQHLSAVFAMLLILPPGVLAFGWWWRRVPLFLRARVASGYEPLLLLPVLILLAMLAFVLAEPLEWLIFRQDLRQWLTREAGIDYNQRNAMVVGIAMGFSVIPMIYSIAEDAIHGVPASLPNGSLALGATLWQSLVRVVLPTASPGIFSALMIGLGRAVGETMIVLMATGNTPLMDWNLFEGMRTLSANVAIEMPESEVASTHYRVLFLAALTLFLFTFVVNTGAEVVRQRLRERYSSL